MSDLRQPGEPSDYALDVLSGELADQGDTRIPSHEELHRILCKVYAIDGLPSRPAVEGEADLTPFPPRRGEIRREAERRNPPPSPSGEADEVEAVAREMRTFENVDAFTPSFPPTKTAQQIVDWADRLDAARPRGAELQEEER